MKRAKKQVDRKITALGRGGASDRPKSGAPSRRRIVVAVQLAFAISAGAAAMAPAFAQIACDITTLVTLTASDTNATLCNITNTGALNINALDINGAGVVLNNNYGGALDINLGGSLTNNGILNNYTGSTLTNSGTLTNNGNLYNDSGNCCWSDFRPG